MKFTKMHGLGNDYIYINCFEENVEHPEELSIRLSNRNFGIGADGLVLILPSETEDFKMRMFNADGSEGEMCGNALRCIGKFVYDYGLTSKKYISIETQSGIKEISLRIKNEEVVSVKVDMGAPILEASRIPSLFSKSPVVKESLLIEGETYEVTSVSMGNPHVVIFLKRIDNLSLINLGPKFEFHPMFPHKANVEFVEVVHPNYLKMRVWEKGSGETLACGTGACAVLVAAVLNGLAERKSVVELKGGKLMIEWNEKDNHVYMIGPATTVFQGEIEV